MADSHEIVGGTAHKERAHGVGCGGKLGLTDHVIGIDRGGVVTTL